jgi:hypothetical protein
MRGWAQEGMSTKLQDFGGLTLSPALAGATAGQSNLEEVLLEADIRVIRKPLRVRTERPQKVPDFPLHIVLPARNRIRRDARPVPITFHFLQPGSLAHRLSGRQTSARNSFVKG